MNEFDNIPRAQPQMVRLALPTSRPWLSWILLGLIILVFLGQLASEAMLGFDAPLVLGAKVNDLIIAGEWWRLLAPVLLHGGLAHLAFNAYALYRLGPEIESLYGAPRFAAIYLLSALAGNVSSFVFSPAISVGASTALFGLIAAQVSLVYRNRDKFGRVGQQQLSSVVMVIVINLSLGLLPGSRIDNLGHLGGLIGGAAVSWLLCPQYDVELEPNGFPRLVDRNSPQRAWPGVALLALAILAGAALKIMSGQ